MNKVAPFKKFLETFETDEMRDYCGKKFKIRSNRRDSTKYSR
mgnify:CR=1 FL=1